MFSMLNFIHTLSHANVGKPTACISSAPAFHFKAIFWSTISNISYLALKGSLIFLLSISNTDYVGIIHRLVQLSQKENNLKRTCLPRDTKRISFQKVNTDIVHRTIQCRGGCSVSLSVLFVFTILLCTILFLFQMAARNIKTYTEWSCNFIHLFYPCYVIN